MNDQEDALLDGSHNHNDQDSSGEHLDIAFSGYVPPPAQHVFTQRNSARSPSNSRNLSRKNSGAFK